MSEHARRESDWAADRHHDSGYRDDAGYHDARDDYDHHYQDEHNPPPYSGYDAAYNQPEAGSHDEYDYDERTGDYIADDGRAVFEAERPAANQHDYDYRVDDRAHHDQITHYAESHPGSEFLQDYQPGDRIEPAFDPAIDPTIDNVHSTHYDDHQAYEHHNDEYFDDPAQSESVWMKEKLGRISFSDYDLQDVNRPKHSSMATTLAGFAGVAAMLGLIGFLSYASLPDLSPQEIIAMQGYAGEQPTKTPFNLASLRDCETPGQCGETEIIPATATTAATVPAVNQAATISSTDNTLSSTNSTLTSAGSIDIGSGTQVSSGTFTTDGYTIVQEIPATTTGSYETISSTSAGDGYASDYNNTGYGSGDLTVLQQWSNVRSSPEINGDILTSLAQGTSIRQLSQSGQWIEVEVTGRSQPVIGYMHRSTVAPR